MVFTSFGFPVFLLLSGILYFITPLSFRWMVLLLSSLVFYGMAGLIYLPFILFSAGVAYLSALFFSKRNEKLKLLLLEEADKEGKNRLKKSFKRTNTRVLILSLAALLCILCYSKFGAHIINLINNITKNGFNVSPSDIIVPLGISYYTFTAIGYMLDVYWKHYEAERNPCKLLLFLIFFPHILQGPFARYNHLSKQLYVGHPFNFDRVTKALQLMLWGYFQKLVIADRLNVFVDSVYGNWRDNRGLTLIIATIFCAIQMYTDFAGCMCIARGIAEIFGIQLEKNFRQPFFANSVAEFWRRWHITLGNWFKDYLCMPLVMANWVKKLSKRARNRWGQNAGKNVITIISLSAVWLATGLWHGTGWNYIIWGVIQGSIIIMSSLLEPFYERWRKFFHIREKAFEWRAFSLIRTFILCGMITKPFTRLATVPEALGFFKNTFSAFNPWILFDGTLYTFGLEMADFYLALLSIAVLCTVSILHERGVHIREAISKRNICVRWGFYYAAIMSIAVFGMYGPGFHASSFVYMGF